MLFAMSKVHSHSNSQLAKMRVSQDLKLKDIAELTGLSESRLSSMECGYTRELGEDRITAEIKNLWDLYGITSLQEFNRLLEEAYQLNKVKVPDTYNTYETLLQGKDPIQKTKQLPKEKLDKQESEHSILAQESNKAKNEEESMEKSQYTKEQIQELLKRLYTSLEYEDFMMILSLLPQDIKPN